MKLTNEDFHKGFRELKKHFSIVNKDISEMVGYNETHLRNITNKRKTFPRSLKLAVWIYLKMK